MTELDNYLKPLTDKYTQLLTRGDIQLPGCGFANVSAFLYLSGKQTSQRIGAATEYTATVFTGNCKTNHLTWIIDSTISFQLV